MESMRIVLDNLIFAWQRSGGVSVVWVELIKGLLKASDVALQMLEYQGSETHNIMRQTLRIPANLLRILSRCGFVLKRYFSDEWYFVGKEDEPFIFHSSYYRYSKHPKAINVVTVHDFTYERFVKSPALYLHRWQKGKALRAAHHIVCISEHTKADLLAFYPDIDLQRVRVIYNGVSDTYRPLTGGTEISPSSLATPYLLFIGSRAKYKRFDIAVEAAARSGLVLSIVGPPLSSIEEKLLREHQVQWYHHGFQEEEALRHLYAHAVALIYASEYEGFGIPVVEAQRCGCPVIACATSSIPEVIGEYPILLKRPDSAVAAQYIQRLQEDNAFRHHVITLGIENAQRFSWDSMREQYLQLYREIWNQHQ